VRPWVEVVMSRYQRLFEQNEKSGTFYLQSKAGAYTRSVFCST
jgi:hypothetical protein